MIISPAIAPPSPALMAFMAAVDADETLQVIFGELLAAATDEAGKMRVAAQAAAVDLPLSIDDISALLMAAENGHDQGPLSNQPLSDQAMDSVGGGSATSSGSWNRYAWGLQGRGGRK